MHLFRCVAGRRRFRFSKANVSKRAGVAGILPIFWGVKTQLGDRRLANASKRPYKISVSVVCA